MRNCPTDLLRPLCSMKRDLYISVLDHLHAELVQGDMSDGFTQPEPSDIKLTIKQFLMVEEGMSDDDLSEEAAKVYDRLKEVGWLKEANAKGYRKTVFMPLAAGSLYTTLATMEVGEVDSEAECEAVIVWLDRANDAERPVETRANALNEASVRAKSYVRRLGNLVAASQELAQQVNDIASAPEQVELFFERYIQDLFPNFKQASSGKGYPYGRIRQILDLTWTIDIQADAAFKEACEVKALIKRIEHDIRLIKPLIQAFEDWTQTITSRINEIIHYASRNTSATEDAVVDALELIADMPQTDTTTWAPARHIAVNALYEPRTAKPPASVTRVERAPADPRAIAMDKLMSKYLETRANDPARLLETLLQWYKQGIRDTNGIAIDTIEDYVAFSQLLDLYHASSTHPLAPVLKYFRVELTGGETRNDYLTCPTLRFELNEALYDTA